MIDRLFLNEQEVDLDEKSIIALTSQLEDIASVDTKNVSFSYTINLPPTKRNQLVMKSCELTTSTTVLPYRKMKAKVIKKGVEVVPYGIGEVIGTNDSGYQIQVAFGGANFWDAIEGKMLSDLGQVDYSKTRIANTELGSLTDWVLNDVWATSSFAPDLLQQVSSSPATEGISLTKTLTGLQKRSATFRIEIRTGAWNALLSDGPQELSVFVGSNSITIATNVQPNTTYIRYIFVSADEPLGSHTYGIGMYSTFTAPGVINEVNYIEIIECPSLSSMNHIFGISAIESTRANQGGYKYPVIDYGDLDNLVRTINPKNQRAAVFSTCIAEAIIKEAGFEPRGRLFDEAQFKRQIHPFANDKLQRSQKWIDDHSFLVHVKDYTIGAPGAGPVTLDYAGIDDKTSTGYYDPAGLVTLGNWATASGPPSAFITNGEPARYKYTLSITFTATGWSFGSSGFSIEIGGITVYDHGVDGFGNGSFQRILEIELERPDIVAFPTEEIVTSAFNCTIDIFFTTFRGVPQKDIYYGSTYEIAPNLDNMSQKDFMKGIMLEYCIVPDVKVFSNDVALRFFDEITDSAANPVDWSNKYDTSKRPASSFTIGDYARKNLMEFAEDSDDKNIVKGYGDGYFLIDNENLKGSKTAATLPFAASVSDNRLLQLMIPIITKIEDGEFKRKTKPRILIDDTQFITTGNVTWNDGVNSFATSEDIPMCYFAKGSYYDLLFENLLLKFWKGKTKLLQNARGEKVLLKFSASDFASLDHFRCVHIPELSSTFYVNKVPKFDGQDGKLTEAELVRI